MLFPADNSFLAPYLGKVCALVLTVQGQARSLSLSLPRPSLSSPLPLSTVPSILAAPPFLDSEETAHCEAWTLVSWVATEESSDISQPATISSQCLWSHS